MAGLLHPGLVILSGAGLSAESGVPTFRGLDGLWEGQRIEDVATLEAFNGSRSECTVFTTCGVRL